MRALPAIALLMVGCSLLAPDDEFFVGGVPCRPAPPCGTYPEADETLTPADAARLPSIVVKAAPGTTIALEPGTYELFQTLEIVADGVTLRSTSANPADVVLSGPLPVIVAVSSSDVTLANLTLTGSAGSAVLLSPPLEQRSERLRLCNVTIRDAGTHAVNAIEGGGYADCVLIEDSTIELTPAGRPVACCATCIPMGVRVASGRGWVIRRSHFAGFFCQDAMGACTNTNPVAMTFLFGSRDTLIENNRIDDANRGIVLGYQKTDQAVRSYYDEPDAAGIDHFDGVIRNNVISGHPVCFDTGIELNRALRTRVLHNTIVPLDLLGYAAIDRRYATTFAYVENNLVRGKIGVRECGQAPPCPNDVLGVEAGNHPIEGDLATYFADAAFHLAPGAPAIDTGVVVEGTGFDLDGEPHDAGAAPDPGADEFR